MPTVLLIMGMTLGIIFLIPVAQNFVERLAEIRIICPPDTLTYLTGERFCTINPISLVYFSFIAVIIFLVVKQLTPNRKKTGIEIPEDTYDRFNFASKVYEKWLLPAADKNREGISNWNSILIEGGYGTGKTWVLNVLRGLLDPSLVQPANDSADEAKNEEQNICTKIKHTFQKTPFTPVVVNFNPWQYSEQKNVFQGFIETLQTEIGGLRFRFIASQFLRASASGNFGSGAMIFSWLFPPVSLEQAKQNINQYLADDKKIIFVFIEDVDRLGAINQQNIAETIKLIGDFEAYPQIRFITALSRDKVQKFLDLEADYQEKLFDYTRDLPAISDRIMEKILTKKFKHFFDKHDSSSKTVGVSISPWDNFLPEGKLALNTPRKIQRFFDEIEIIITLMNNQGFNAYDLAVITYLKIFEPETYSFIQINSKKLLHKRYCPQGSGKIEYADKNYNEEILLEDLIKHFNETKNTCPQSIKAQSNIYEIFDVWNSHKDKTYGINSVIYFPRYFNPTAGDIMNPEQIKTILHQWNNNELTTEQKNQLLLNFDPEGSNYLINNENPYNDFPERFLDILEGLEAKEAIAEAIIKDIQALDYSAFYGYGIVKILRGILYKVSLKTDIHDILQGMQNVFLIFLFAYQNKDITKIDRTTGALIETNTIDKQRIILILKNKFDFIPEVAVEARLLEDLYIGPFDKNSYPEISGYFGKIVQPEKFQSYFERKYNKESKFLSEVISYNNKFFDFVETAPHYQIALPHFKKLAQNILDDLNNYPEAQNETVQTELKQFAEWEE